DYKAINRGSTQPLITQGDLKKTVILIPDTKTLLAFEKIVGGLMNKTTFNKVENQRLSAVRDTLLPKLMNGKIDVSEVKI
ncbi:MAG: restriction endonuclease subunit S, partial [Ruminococcus sp.]|nr:restriction endonuclease subunit S [Ruminococcus sp.]